MASERVETITAPDGGTFEAFTAVPDGGTGPGVLVLQEIFGVGEFVEGRCRQLADAGFVALAPDVFWRVQPGFDPPAGEAGLGEAFALAQRWSAEVPRDVALGDLGAALAHLRGLPEVGGGRVAALGWCFGGTWSFAVACAHDVDALVSYYGSGTAGLLDAHADQLSCPALFHYGGEDPYLPMADVQAVVDRFADRDDVTVEVEAGAGHAFENWTSAMFHDEAAAARSWPKTLAFLDRTLR